MSSCLRITTSLLCIHLQLEDTIIYNTWQGARLWLTMPTVAHQHPAVLLKDLELLWPQTTTHFMPQLILAVTAVIDRRQFDLVAADVPEENSEGIDIDGSRVRAIEQLRCHVDRCAHQRHCHHGFRLAKAKVGQLATVVSVQL